MNKIINMIKILSEKKLRKFVSMAFFVSIFLMENSFFGKSFFKKITGESMLDMNFINSPAFIHNYLSIIGAAGRELYLRLLSLDYILIISFFFLQATVLYRLFKSYKKDSLFYFVVIPPLVRGLMDIIENITMTINTQMFPLKSEYLLFSASLSTTIKWIFLWITLSEILFFLLHKAYKRFILLIFRNKQRS